MENPGKLIRIFFYFLLPLLSLSFSTIFVFIIIVIIILLLLFFFIYRSKLRRNSLLHLLCPGHPRERNDRSVVILASEIYH